MGARESKARNLPDDQKNDTTGALDYYQILEVDENATADEIKVGRMSNTKGPAANKHYSGHFGS